MSRIRLTLTAVIAGNVNRAASFDIATGLRLLDARVLEDGLGVVP